MKLWFKELSIVLIHGNVSLNASFHYAVDDDQDGRHGLGQEYEEKLIKSVK